MVVRGGADGIVRHRAELLARDVGYGPTGVDVDLTVNYEEDKFGCCEFSGGTTPKQKRKNGGNKMSTKSKTAKTKRSQLKVRDLRAAKDPRGGKEATITVRKAGKGQL
jgi:hypothetical protein